MHKDGGFIMKILKIIFIFIIPLLLFCSEDKAVDPGDEKAPGTPEDLAVTYVGNGEITIAWSSNQEPDIAGYRIYRSINDNSSGSFTLICDTTSTSFKDTGLDYENTYYYSVSSYDLEGFESDLSQAISARPLNVQAPSTPANFKAVAHNIATTFIRLVWTPNTENDLLGYYIYRSENPNFTISQETLLDSSTTAVYIDQNVNVNVMYYYRVTAFDKGHWEGLPTGVVGDVPLPPATLLTPEDNGITSGTPTFSWEAVPYAQKYLLIVMTSQVGGEIWTKSLNAGTNSVKYTGSSTLQSGNTYYWKLGTVTNDPDDINSISVTRSFVVQ